MKDKSIHAMNPFRDSMMRQSFNECVTAWKHNSSALQRTSGNSISHYFWKGYDNIPLNWDVSSRRLMSYAQYRAGQCCRKLKLEE